MLNVFRVTFQILKKVFQKIQCDQFGLILDSNFLIQN